MTLTRQFTYKQETDPTCAIVAPFSHLPNLEPLAIAFIPLSSHRQVYHACNIAPLSHPPHLSFGSIAFRSSHIFSLNISCWHREILSITTILHFFETGVFLAQKNFFQYLCFFFPRHRLTSPSQLMERPKSRLDRYPSVHSSVPGSIRSEPPPSYSYQNRRVLAEKPSRANTTIGAIPTFHPHKYKTAQRSDQEEVPPQPSLPPRNESIVPELTEPGKLAVRHDSRTTSPGHKRISQIQEEEINQDIESKRSSVVSTLSDGTPSKRKSHIGPWHLGKTIGKGGCSSVREVRHRRSTFKAAAKIIAKSAAENIREQSVANLHRIRKHEKATIAMAKSMPYGLEREIVIMKLLNHPHIVQLYDVWENRNEL